MINPEVKYHVRPHVSYSSDEKQQNILRANGVSVLESEFIFSPLQVKKLALMLTMTNQTAASVFSLSTWKADQAHFWDLGK